MWDVVAVLARLQNEYFLIESRIREAVSNLGVCLFCRPISQFGYTRANWRIKGKRSDAVLYIKGVDVWTVRQLADTVP